MANSAQDIRRRLPPIQTPVESWIVPASRQTWPFWFNGRLLAAHDLERDQIAFLQRQARLNAAVGFGVVHGLLVERITTNDQEPDAESFVIRAGHGITPGGGTVMLAKDLTVQISDLSEEENLQAQFGLSSDPTPIARTRTGLYVIALRPVQFTANPISAYPTSIQGSLTTRDGAIVEATAVSLVPYPMTSSPVDPTAQRAAAARQIFVEGEAGALSPSLLPIAMACIQRGALVWVDPYLVRRESGPEFSGLRFGVPEPATQQAFLLQYDAQLEQIVQDNPPTPMAATDYFQALPPAGRFPLDSIDWATASQVFFPPQTQVSLSVIPEDELPAVIEDSLSLSPIDLTMPASSYADLSMLALVAVPRAAYATVVAGLPPITLTSAVPQILNSRAPLDLLKRFRFGPAQAAPSADWQAAIGTQVYGYYVRRRSAPALQPLAAAPATSATTLVGEPIAGVSGIALTATVSPSNALGTVTFKDGAVTLGTVALNAATAVLIVPTLASGQHSLTATYNGNVNSTSSTSTALSQTVP